MKFDHTANWLLGGEKKLGTSILVTIGLCVATVSLQRAFLGDLPIVFTPAFCTILIAAWFTNAWVAGLASITAAILINSWLLEPSEPGSTMACAVFLAITAGFVAVVRWVNRRFRMLQSELERKLSNLQESIERNDSLRSELEKIASELQSTRISLLEYSQQNTKQRLCLKSTEDLLLSSQSFLDHLPIPVIGVRAEDDVWAVRQANRAFLRLCRMPENDLPAVLQGYGNFSDLNGLPLDETLHPISRIGRGERVQAEFMQFRIKETNIPVILWGTSVQATGEVALAAIPVSEILPSQ